MVDWAIDSGQLAGSELELRTENKNFNKSTRILQASHNFVSCKVGSELVFVSAWCQSARRYKGQCTLLAAQFARLPKIYIGRPDYEL